MTRLRCTAWLATSVLLTSSAALAQTHPPAKPEGGVAPPATGPAPANPSADPDSAGAIRYQGDPRGETESETRTKNPRADERAPAKGRSDDKAPSPRADRKKEKPADPAAPRS